MVKVQNIIRHFCSPFYCKEKDVKLSSSQIKKTLAISLPLFALGIVPGIVALYAISGVMMKNKIKKNREDSASLDKTVSSIFQVKKGHGSETTARLSRTSSLDNVTVGSLAPVAPVSVPASRAFSRPVMITDDDSKELDEDLDKEDDSKTKKNEVLLKELEASLKDGHKKVFESLYTHNVDAYFDLIHFALTNDSPALEGLFFNEEVLTGFLAKYSDVELTFPDDLTVEDVETIQPLKMNKALLGYCFGYFTGMFSSGFKETSSSSIAMIETSQSTFLQLLNYRLFGSLQVTIDNFQELAVLADYLFFSDSLRLSEALRLRDNEFAEILHERGISITAGEELFELAERYQLHRLQSIIFAKVYKAYDLLRNSSIVDENTEMREKAKALLNDWVGRMKLLYVGHSKRGKMDLANFWHDLSENLFSHNIFEVLIVDFFEDGEVAKAVLKMPHLKKISFRKIYLQGFDEIQAHLQSNGGGIFS